MSNYMCVRCGVQYAATVRPPARCAICEDEREAVYSEGQRWTTLADLRREVLALTYRLISTSNTHASNKAARIEKTEPATSQ
jgi:hypothetical protein